MKIRLKKKLFVLLAVIGLLIFLHVTRIIKPVEDLVTMAMSPLLENLYFTGNKIKKAYNNQFNKRNLLKEIENLEESNQKLVSENAKLKTFEEENEILKNYLQFKAENTDKLLIAEIISRNNLVNNSNDEKHFSINRGKVHGVRDGMVIVNSNGIVVGKIIEVKNNISYACMITDSQCKFAVALQNADKTSGVAQGELGLTIKIGFIPQTENVEKGDTVITSGLESEIPRGLVIGQVADIKKESNELWQEATVEPIDDFENLISVAIIVSM